MPTDYIRNHIARSSRSFTLPFTSTVPPTTIVQHKKQKPANHVELLCSTVCCDTLTCGRGQIINTVTETPERKYSNLKIDFLFLKFLYITAEILSHFIGLSKCSFIDYTRILILFAGIAIFKSLGPSNTVKYYGASHLTKQYKQYSAANTFIKNFNSLD